MGAVRCKRRPIIVNNKEHAESIFGWSYDSLLRPERRRPVAIPSEVKGEKREFFPVVRPHIVVDVVQRWNCLSFHLSSALRYTTTQFRFWLWCTTSESGGQGRKKERKKERRRRERPCRPQAWNWHCRRPWLTFNSAESRFILSA